MLATRSVENMVLGKDCFIRNTSKPSASAKLINEIRESYMIVGNVYLNYNQEELDEQYNNRQRYPEFSKTFED